MVVTSKVRKQILQRASCNAKPHLHFELGFLVFIPADSKSPTRQSLRYGDGA
jgi:hypothetical protein